MRDPSSLFYQLPAIRRTIIVAYWLFVILAIPFWWYATSIQRLSLPTQRVEQLQSQPPKLPLHITVNGLGDTKQLQELLQAREIDAEFTQARSSAESRANDYVVTSSDRLSIEGRTLHIPPRTSSNDLADILSSLLRPSFDTHRTVQYAPRYRLAFSLLNEDSTAGSSLLGWDINSGLQSHLAPTLQTLEALHNFTIESQVQHHAPLAVHPRSLSGNEYGLTPEDLTIFVNSAEWTLSSSVSNDPVLHFILFVPSASRRPLHILHSDGSKSPSNAFLVPQWGGIIILNEFTSSTLSTSDLKPLFATFTQQLLALLGLPRLPPSFISSSTHITEWQLDALMRYRTFETTQSSKDTLRSIIKLVNQIENMPVGQDVKGDVEKALNALEKANEETSLESLFSYSALASTLSSRAFFNPGMLALLYFPAEHKYAVYTPLFASALIPLVGAAVREYLRWKKSKDVAPVK